MSQFQREDKLRPARFALLGCISICANVEFQFLHSLLSRYAYQMKNNDNDDAIFNYVKRIVFSLLF